MKRVVIKLSGSVFNNPTKDSLIKYAETLIKILNNNIQPIVVTGGGKIARFYINLARDLGYDEASLDEIGIIVSRLNARLLIAALNDYAYSKLPEKLDDVVVALNSNKVIVSGGLHVGQSTNATAAIIAEKVRADLFINATDVDGIYSRDPNKYKDVVKFEEIKVNDLRNLLIEQSSAAGEYDLMDIIALKVIERSHINTIVVKADPLTIYEALFRNVGTRIIT